MADKLKKLEQGIADTARSMAGAQNPVGNKLREALGEAQQNELEMHMRQSAQWIRQGYGSSAWVRENNVTLGLNNLRDQLQQAQAANQQSGKPGQQGPGGDSSDLEKALARVQGMRDRMQQLAQAQEGKGKQPGGQGRQSGALQRGNQNGNGQQPGQNGQPGQQAGQGQQAQNGQPGQNGQQGQQGQNGQQGQGGQSGQSGSGGQTGSNANGYAPFGGGGPVTPGNGYAADSPMPIEQAYRESLRDLNQLRDFIRQNPDVAGDYSNLMRALNPQYANNDAELSQRLSHEVLRRWSAWSWSFAANSKTRIPIKCAAPDRKRCRPDTPTRSQITSASSVKASSARDCNAALAGELVKSRRIDATGHFLLRKRRRHPARFRRDRPGQGDERVRRPTARLKNAQDRARLRRPRDPPPVEEISDDGLINSLVSLGAGHRLRKAG